MKISNAFLSLTFFAIGAVSASTILQSNSPRQETAADVGIVVQYPDHPTNSQAQILAMAYDIAKKDGHQYPELLQAIVLQETRAGGMQKYKVAGQQYGLKPTHRYYGVAQIKLAAARDVISRYPQLKKQYKFDTLTDEEIIAKLIDNDQFNLAVASKYLLILKSYGYSTMSELALAYNRGTGADVDDADTDNYAQSVMTKVETLHK